MDPVVVGERIRKIRKQKNLVLQNLSDVFSIGKLSNIEKGKIPVVLDDIKKICERLDVPVDQVIDTENVNVASHVIHTLSEIRALISVGQPVEVRPLIISTKKDIVKHKINYLLPEINFYHGVYHIKRNNYKLARPLLLDVIENDYEFEHAKTFKLRAYNALSYVEYMLGRMSLAWNYTNQAKEMLCSVKQSVDEEANIYFNAAIITTQLGDFPTAQIYAQSALKLSDGSFQHVVRLVIATIQAMTDDFKPALLNTDACIEYFSREEEIKYLTKALQIRYFLFNLQPNKFKDQISIIESTIPRTIINQSRNEKNPPEFLVLGAHVFISLAIDKKRYDFAEKFIKELYEIQSKIPEFRHAFKTYYLHAKVVRGTTKDKEQEKKLLEEALSLMETNESYEKAIIMHELYELDKGENEDGILYRSNELFYKLKNLQLREFNYIQNILPDLRY